MTTNFKLVSFNVRGLRSSDKRKALLLWITKQKSDIAFLQETYSTIKDDQLWRTQWKGNMLFSHGSNHSEGTIILVKQNLEFQQKTIFCDPSGRFIFLEAVVQGNIFFICKYLCSQQSSRTRSDYQKDQK